MPPLKCVFLGYLWPIAAAIKESSNATLIACGVELQRSKASEMTDFCKREQISWFDAKAIRSNKQLDDILSKGVDLIVVGAFGQILDKRLLSASRYGVLNFHPSLLPAYRGGSPIEEMLLRGDTNGGATFHWMVENVDEGPIVMGEAVKVGNSDDYTAVLNKCIDKGRAMMTTLLKMPVNEWPHKPQQVSTGSSYAMRKPEDGLIDWRMDAEHISRIIKALGWRGWVRCMVGKEEFIVRRASLVTRQGRVGEILSTEPLVIACGRDALEILEYSFSGNFAKGETLI